MQFFWSKLGEMYYDALMYAKSIGKLHLAACRGVIMLIPKKDKNPNFLKNWRPLTMLNIDYKILATVLASRMKEVYPQLIAPTQTGFMKGRQTTSTIRTTIDIARYSKIPGYILSLDFEKCFDRIEYSSILGSLSYLGFGLEFIDWTKLLFQEFQSVTTNNGHFSSYLNIERSCHQGCPAAPYII